MPRAFCPPAARVGDPVLTPRGPGVILSPGAPRVLIEGRPAARKGDLVQVPRGPPVPIEEGSMSVFHQGQEAARVGDRVAGGGVIVAGATRTNIGVSNEHASLTAAARAHAPFVRRG